MILMRQSMNDSMLSITKIKNEDEGRSGQRFFCSDCGRAYKLKSSLRNHQKWECGKEPQFSCPYCSYRAKQKMHITRHIERMHKVIDYSAIEENSTIKNDSINVAE